MVMRLVIILSAFLPTALACLGQTGGDGGIGPVPPGTTAGGSQPVTAAPTAAPQTVDPNAAAQQAQIDQIPCQFVTCTFEGGSLCLYESSGNPALPKDLYFWALSKPEYAPFMAGQQLVQPEGGHSVVSLPLDPNSPSVQDPNFNGRLTPSEIEDDHSNLTPVQRRLLTLLRYRQLRLRRGRLFQRRQLMRAQTSVLLGRWRRQVDHTHDWQAASVGWPHTHDWLTNPDVPNPGPVPGPQPNANDPNKKAWLAWKGRFGNRVTGVPSAAVGDWFGVTYLLPGQFAVMESEFLFTQDTTIEFRAYEAVAGMHLQLCCDSLDKCDVISPMAIVTTDRQWKTHTASCPRGTQKFFFLCKNEDKEQGACGIDDVRVATEQCPSLQGRHETPGALIDAFNRAKPWMWNNWAWN